MMLPRFMVGQNNFFHTCFLLLVFFNSDISLSAASNPYRGCFTNEIYGEMNDANDINFLKILTSSGRRKFYDRKKQRIKGLLDPLESEKKCLSEQIDDLEVKSGGKMLVAGVISFTLAGPLGGMIGSILYAAGEGTSFERKKKKLIRKQGVLEKKRLLLNRGLWSGDLPKLEVKYLGKKQDFDPIDQNLIEHFFLEQYETGHDYTPAVKDIMNFPRGVFCICGAADPKLFRDKLRDLKEAFQHQDAVPLLTGLAKAGYEALRKKDIGTRYLAYCQNITGIAPFKALYTAVTLNQFVYRLDAQDYPLLDESFLYGEKGSFRGLVLSIFLDEEREAQVAKRSTNPIIIIENFDVWASDERNLPFLLPLLDKTRKTFKSLYFGKDVDWNGLNIIGVGTQPKSNFDPAIGSRLANHKL